MNTKVWDSGGTFIRPRLVAAVALAIGLAGPFGCGTVREWRESSGVAGVILPPDVQPSPSAAVGDRIEESDLSSGEQGTNPSNADESSGNAQADPPSQKAVILDLESALGLADVGNPTIGLAREAVRASLAAQLQARVLLVPTLDVGASVNVHDGNLESARGIIRDVDRRSLYAGAGALAVGAGTVGVPGARINVHLADAVFEPRVARQRVTARSFDAQATRNTILLEVVTRYFALAAAEAQLRALRELGAEYEEVARVTANFARKGQGREADAERARTEALLLHGQEQAAEEEVAVASAELARVLDLDPSLPLRTAGQLQPLVSLVNPDTGFEELIQTALRNRPEVEAQQAEVALLATRLRQEQARPFVPAVSIGYSAGTFGGGSNLAANGFGHFGGRTDFDALAVWSLANFGLGNLSIQKRVRAEVRAAEAEQARVINQVSQEVAEARAQSLAAWQEIKVARQRIASARNAFQRDLRRTKNVLGHVIETLDSLHLLTSARLDLIRGTAAYNEAQFRLFVALGQPPTLALPKTQDAP
jgi:outer membrane protein TolC